MDERQKRLIVNLSLGKLSEDDFLEEFSDNIDHDLDILRLLMSVKLNEDAGELECVMLLGFHFGFPVDCGSILCEILGLSWHQQHENIVFALQKIKFAGAAEALYIAAISHFAYLEYDETYALGVKCEYALRAIGTASAKDKLIALSRGANKVLAENALKMLSAFE